MAGDVASAGSDAGKSGTGSPKCGQDLPVRYVCEVCGVCAATSEALATDAAREDAVVFKRLYFAAEAGGVEKVAKTVVCPGCEQALGTRGDGSFALRRDRVVRRLERLEILVCGLKQQELSDLTPVLRECFSHCNVTTKVLLKAELRGFQLCQRPAPDFVVVVHRNEGRALLTDRNGFYHDVLGSAWQQTRGNVAVVLTRAAPKAELDLFDQQMLRSLSTQGDQPTIGAISALGRVLTWDTSPSKPQLKQLQALAAKAYYREPLQAQQGIPAQWSRALPKAASSSSAAWCTLL